MGIDWNGPLPFSDDSTVSVEPPVQPLNDQDYIELCNTINPTGPSNNYAIDIYCDTLGFILAKLM